jgi:serine/threonine protein kinase
MSLELLIEKENIEKKIKTLMPTEEDYKTLIEKAGLIEINNYKFDKFINKGNASSTAIYKNKQENILVKFLIGPRNSDELSSFCNEFYAQSIINKNKIQGFKSIPEIKIDLNKAKNFPIIFFGMEFIEGKSLKDIINKNRHNKCFPLKWEEALNIIHRIAITLSEIHVKGFVHRDLHPGNIIILSNKEIYKFDKVIETNIRILDLGNRSSWSIELINPDEYNKQEDKYRPKGSITSWSPEYLLNRDKTIGTAQDIWALGVIFFHLLSGTYPIYAKSISELISKYLKGEKSIQWNKLPKDIPYPIIFLLKRMLEFDHNKRINTGPLTRICYDIRYSDLLNENPNYINDYLNKDGQVDDPLDYIY